MHGEDSRRSRGFSYIEEAADGERRRAAPEPAEVEINAAASVIVGVSLAGVILSNRLVRRANSTVS